MKEGVSTPASSTATSSQINLGMPPQQTTSLSKFIIDLRHIITYPQRFVRHAIHRQYIQIIRIGILKIDAHTPYTLLCRGSCNVRGISLRKETIQVCRNIFTGYAFHKERYCLSITAASFSREGSAWRLRTALEASRKVCRRFCSATVSYHFGRYKIDTGGKVGHLQTAIRHLRTA